MVCDHVSCALRGYGRTSESPGRLRRSAPYKGLRPLRRFAAIPAPSAGKGTSALRLHLSSEAKTEYRYP